MKAPDNVGDNRHMTGDHSVSPPAQLFTDDTAEQRWRARFTAPRASLPYWARTAPHRSLLLSNASGASEAYIWDREKNDTRRVTDQPNGTDQAMLSADGTQVWWFADPDGEESGVWMRQPFDGSHHDAVPALAGVPAGYMCGINLGESTVAVGVGADDGVTVWLAGDRGPARAIHRADDCWVAALSGDERLLAIERSEDGGAGGPALLVLATADGSVVAEKRDDASRVEILDFAPVPGDSRLLIRREHDATGATGLAIWDVEADREVALDLDLDPASDVLASWYPDGSALLVLDGHHARSVLHRYDLATGELIPVPTPRGTVDDASVRPDGQVEYVWSSAAHPPAVRTVGPGGDRELLRLPGTPAPAGTRLTDVFVDGPHGRVHALAAEPADGGAGPHPTIFLLHGGPHVADQDRFSAYRAVWPDAGFAVVHVNYRGSVGYGPDWRRAIYERPGLTELADIAAVHDWAVKTGLADPARCVVAGTSWGGYLALLAVGTQPDRWAAAIAEEPVADYVSSYDDKLDSLRAFDRTLFGGTPDEVPDRYRKASPITYVDQVRAPVLLIAGVNDPRCPVRQINTYLGRLAELGAHHEVYWFDAGHRVLVVDEIIRQAALQVDFARRVTGGDMNDTARP